MMLIACIHWASLACASQRAYLLKSVDIKKTTVFARMIRGPAGKPENSEMQIPTDEDSIPMAVAPSAYWNIFRLRFLALQAGIAAKAAVKRPPTILAPNATIMAIESR